jgi:alpha-tubulin suppressor-like RCC1 family protein
VGALTGITAIAAGDDHSLALAADGSLWAWGGNSTGQLGDGTTTRRRTPVLVSTPTGFSGVVAIRGGDGFSLALLADGTVWAWGTNSSGQVGDGTAAGVRRTPVRVRGLSGIGVIGSGDSHALAALGSPGG